MALLLIEEAVDQLYSYLNTNLAAKLTELNTRYGDAVTLENIKTYYQGAMPFNYPEVPSIALVARGMRPEEGQITTVIEGNNLIDIVVMVGEADLEKRFRLLSRYALAIIELLIGSFESATGYCFYFNGPLEFSDVLNTPDFLQGVQIPVRLYKIEG